MGPAAGAVHVPLPLFMESVPQDAIPVVWHALFVITTVVWYQLIAQPLDAVVMPVVPRTTSVESALAVPIVKLPCATRLRFPLITMVPAPNVTVVPTVNVGQSTYQLPAR